MVHNTCPPLPSALSPSPSIFASSAFLSPSTVKLSPLSADECRRTHGVLKSDVADISQCEYGFIQLQLSI